MLKFPGIFFKFAVDSQDLYGGDAFSMKSASNELNGLKSYFEWIRSDSKNNLRTGLMVSLHSLSLLFLIF